METHPVPNRDITSKNKKQKKHADISNYLDYIQNKTHNTTLLTFTVHPRFCQVWTLKTWTTNGVFHCSFTCVLATLFIHIYAIIWSEHSTMKGALVFFSSASLEAVLLALA